MLFSGMITHGDFMLTLVLLYSFVLSFVCFVLFLFASYSTVSYFPYYVHIGVFIYMLYKALLCQLRYFLSMYKASNVFFFLFLFKSNTHTQLIFASNCSSRSQTNKQRCHILQNQKSGDKFQPTSKISEYCAAYS